MSFSKKIQKSVDDTIQDFIKNISKTYNIDYTEIYNIWSNGYDIKNLNTIETQVQVQNQNITSNSKDDKQKIINNLNKLTKPDLVEMCKNKGLIRLPKIEVEIDRIIRDRDNSLTPK